MTTVSTGISTSELASAIEALMARYPDYVWSFNVLYAMLPPDKKATIGQTINVLNNLIYRGKIKLCVEDCPPYTGTASLKVRLI